MRLAPPPSSVPPFLSVSAFSGWGLTAALRRGRCGAPTRGAARGSGTSAGTGCSAAAGGGWRRRSSSASPRWTPFLRPPTPLRRSLGVVGSRHRKSWGGRSALGDGITITVVRVLVAHSAAKYSGVTKKYRKNMVAESPEKTRSGGIRRFPTQSRAPSPPFPPVPDGGAAAEGFGPRRPRPAAPVHPGDPQEPKRRFGPRSLWRNAAGYRVGTRDRSAP